MRRRLASGRLSGVVEPLPRWAKCFDADVVLGLLSLLLWRLVLDRVGGAVPAAWRVDPGAALEPDTRKVPIVVNEAECASGRSAAGRIEVDVTYGTETVTFAVAVRRLKGGQDCQGNPDTEHAVRLDQALGDRDIAGERWPAP